MSQPERELRYRVYPVPEGTRSVTVAWERFVNFADACERFPEDSCLYSFQRSDRTSLYVGKATGLRKRYAADSGALGALLNYSGALLFVAPIVPSLLLLTEHTIIFWDCTSHNKQGQRQRPFPHVTLLHQFNGVTSWWGSGNAREPGATYEGPLFSRPGEIRDAHTGIPK